MEIQRLDYEQQLRKAKEQINNLQQILETQKKLTAKSECGPLLNKDDDAGDYNGSRREHTRNSSIFTAIRYICV